MPPFCICIAGASRAGKTTLARGIRERLCGPQPNEKRRFKRERVDRCGRNGIRVSVVCQDRFFLGNSLEADDPKALDHDSVYDTLVQEKADISVDCLIFEGFKALYDARVPELFDILLWIEVKKEVSCKRRISKRCTEEHFNDQIWTRHEQYVSQTVSNYVDTLHLLCGEDPTAKVLDDALGVVTQMDEKLKAVVEAADHVPPQRSGAWAEYGLARESAKFTRVHETDPPIRRCSRSPISLRQSTSAPTQQVFFANTRRALYGKPRPILENPGDELRVKSSLQQGRKCANPNCWFEVDDGCECGGYCSSKSHWRDTTGKKSGKAHEKCDEDFRNFGDSRRAKKGDERDASKGDRKGEDRHRKTLDARSPVKSRLRSCPEQRSAVHMRKRLQKLSNSRSRSRSRRKWCDRIPPPPQGSSPDSRKHCDRSDGKKCDDRGASRGPRITLIPRSQVKRRRRSRSKPRSPARRRKRLQKPSNSRSKSRSWRKRRCDGSPPLPTRSSPASRK